MQPITPTPTLPQDDLNKSLNKVLTGNVSPGNGLTFDTNGQPLTYSIDNQSGVLLRIGAVGNPVGAPFAWTGSNTNLTIQHNLNKVPYGFHIVAKSATCDVFWGTIQPTLMNITLQTTNDAADVTIFVMV